MSVKIPLKPVLATCVLLSPFLLAFVLLFPSDVVKLRYETKAEAAADQLFGKGWLPDFIPDGTADLKINNNLDLNTSWGDFKFPANEWSFFASHLKGSTTARAPFTEWEETLRDYRSRGFQEMYYEEGRGVWAFFCDAARGRCEYQMWMTQK